MREVDKEKNRECILIKMYDSMKKKIKKMRKTVECFQMF